MVPRTAPGAEVLGAEQGADLAQWPENLGVGAAVDERRAGVGPVEPEHHAHGGGFPRAVRAEEPGDDTRGNGEAQAVDGQRLVVALRQTMGDDHGTLLSQRLGRSAPPASKHEGRAPWREWPYRASDTGASTSV